MKFHATPLAGAWAIECERAHDERGWFLRTFDRDAFVARGIDPAVVQCNTSFNAAEGTLRGLHYQAEPHAEPKLVRCSQGEIFDVVVDLRPDSPTRGCWHAERLSAANARMLYVPAGLAHGFQTLAPASEVQYQMGHAYTPSHARGIRWDDPALAIDWPPAPSGGRTVSPRDLALPLFIS